MTLKGLVFVPFFAVSLAAPLAWAGAPPECETDEQCQDWGYESCDGASMTCTEGDSAEDNFECSSDAGCPEGHTCVELSSASYCQGPSPSATDADATGSEDATGTSESASDAGGDDDGGCQGGQSSHGLLAVFAGVVLLVTRRRRLVC